MGFLRKERNLYTLLDDVKRKIEEINDYKSLSSNRGFARLMAELEEKEIVLQKEQNGLCKQPAKNAVEIQSINAIREAIKGLKKIIEQPLLNESKYLAERKFLLEKKEEDDMLNKMNNLTK